MHCPAFKEGLDDCPSAYVKCTTSTSRVPVGGSLAAFLIDYSFSLAENPPICFSIPEYTPEKSLCLAYNRHRAPLNIR